MSSASISMEVETANPQVPGKTFKGQLTGYTMCPNWIYDSLLVEENPSVVKVVLYFNRNTTGRTGASGQRVEFKQATYGLIASRMNMSVRAVGEAVRTALAKGYLVQRKTEHSTRNSAFEGDFYALNWNWPLRVMSNDSDVTPVEENSLIQGVNSSVLSKVTLSSKFNLEAGQVLPGGDRQNLPTCINKTKKSQINLKIELDSASELEKSQDSAVNTVANSTDNQEKVVKLADKFEQKPAEYKVKNRTGRRGSSAVGQLITDLTREFGDKPELVLPNITRALNLWRETGLDEHEFLDRVYQARKKTLACPLIFNRRQSLSGETASGLPNRMPYFFSVLAELVTTAEPVAASPKPVVKAKPSYLIEESTVVSPKVMQSAPLPVHEYESDPAIIRQRVSDTLQQRFRNPQLAEKAASLEFSLNPAEKQVIIFSAASPWLVRSLMSSEVALLQLALIPHIGEGYTLLLQ